jgi:diaminopropionate ammonia-lyase
VEGYTTMLREIDAQLLIHARIQKQDQPLSMIIAPLGVGSLTQSIISYYKSSPKDLSTPAVVTVEPDTAATLHKSLKAQASISIATSPTIMAGLECGTLSIIAWPLLQPGVDISTTISDWECHQAIEYLAKHGIGAGPCGGAALAGLRRLAADSSSLEVLNKDSVVVCICTEGTRPYTLPTPVEGKELTITTALMVLHMTPALESNFRSSPQIVPVSAFLNFAAHWLEYRDINIKWIDPGSSNTSLVARIPGFERDRERKSLFLITCVPAKCKQPAFIHTSLGASLLALGKLKLSTSMARGGITLVITSDRAGLESAMNKFRAPDAILLVNAEFEGLVTLPSGLHTEFANKVKQSVESALGRDLKMRKTQLNESIISGVLKEGKIPVCVVGSFGSGLTEDEGEESEYLLAKTLVKVGEDWCA